MKFLIQAVNIQKCTILFKKAVASAVIFSMLMIDAAKAMDEERGSMGVVQRIPPSNPSSADLDFVDSDSSLKQSPSSDDGDSSPGSISSSPESQKPGSRVEDTSLGVIPFVKVSLASPQLSIVSSPQQNLDETEKKSAPPPVPFHLGSNDSDDEFNPLEVGSLEQNRQKLIAGLPSFEGSTASIQGTPSTVSPRLTAIVPDPSAFKGFQESYPQLQLSSSMGSSPNKAGSLQDRSPSYIPSPHIVPLGHNNNDKSVVPGKNSLAPHSTSSHPLDDSDTGSESDIQIMPSSPHHQSHNIIIRFPNEKKPLPKSRNVSSNKKASPAAMTPSLRNLLMGDGSGSLFSDQPPARPLSVSSNSIRIDDEQYPILEHSKKGSRYASIQANDSLYEEFVLLGDDQDPPVPLRAEEAEPQVGCCCNRPCWPQHTEHILPEDKIQLSSQILKLISYNPSQQIAEKSVSPQSSLNSEHNPDSDDPDDSNSPGSSPDGTSPDSSPTKATHNPMPILDEDESTDSEDSRVIPSLTGYSSDDEDILPANFPSATITIVEDNVLPHVPSHLQPVLNKIEDLEAGLGGQTLESFLKFSQELQSYLRTLPPKTKAQLTDFAYQALNGKSTWSQRLGKWIIGPIIGAGFAFAMGPIYDGGLVYLYDHYGGSFLWSLTGGSLGALIVRYIQISAVPDGISRNAHLWKKGIAYLSQEEKEMGRMCLAGGISFLTAFIPLAFLISAENIARTGLGLPNWDNVFGLVVVVFGIPVYLDAFASDFYTAWNAIPQMKEWLGNLFCRKLLHFRVLSFEETQREKFDSDLGKLKNFLFRAPQIIIDEIFNDIKQIKESLETSFCSKLDEDLASQQAFATVAYLLSLGDEVVKGVTKPKSLYDVSVDIFKYMCLVFGTPARALALQFIGYSVFSLFCPDLVAQILGGVYGLLAFLPQTFMEDLGIDNFSKRFIVDEDSHGHSSHSTYRGCTKLYCAFQGLVYVFPLAVLTLQAFQQWSGNGLWPLAAMVPFIIPEFAAQTYSFNGTFNQQVATAVTNVHSTKTRKCFGKEPAFDWKRDWLIRFIETSRGDLKHWHPDLIHKLTESIEIFKQEDAQS